MLRGYDSIYVDCVAESEGVPIIYFSSCLSEIGIELL